MFLLAAAALAASAPQEAPRHSAVVQATATVRVISGVRLRLDGQVNADAPPARDSIIHTEGVAHSARLIEFE